MTLTTRQTKILNRFWHWIEARGITVEQNEQYCGNREQPTSGIVLRANWNDCRGASVRPFRGMARNYQEAQTRGQGSRYAVPRKREWDDILERIGIACEWVDEWDTCERCEGIYRTQPDEFCWTVEGTYIEPTRDYSSHYHAIEGSLCLDCLEEEARGCREWDLEEERERNTIEAE